MKRSHNPGSTGGCRRTARAIAQYLARGRGYVIGFFRRLGRPGSLRTGDGGLEQRLEQLHDLRWEISDNERRYRDLLDAQDDLVVRRDRDGLITFANRAYLTAFGLDPATAQGRPHEPRVLEREMSSQSCLAPSGAETKRITEHIETVEGPRWIEWEQRMVLEISGDTATQRSGRDVTELRRNAAELCEARDAALSANRAKSRFLAAMSHEIRTPMNGILGMTGLLMSTELDTDQAAYARAIDKSARSLLTLIDEILDFSKIEAGKLQMKSAPFSLCEAISASVALLAPAAEEKGLRIALAIAPEMPERVMGDEERVRQIALNLISNAVKFTDSGRISVTLCLAGGAAPDGRLSVSLRVEDTGIGLTASERERLFTEFEQAEAALQRQVGGTGLGLAISRRLAMAMGGDIYVVSEPGRGSAFTAEFEVARALAVIEAPALGEKPRSTMRKGLPQRSRRVLLAEDNEINALLATRLLENERCQVVRVRTGAEAVERMARALDGKVPAFDLILMDIFMPVLDGVEAAREIRRRFALAGRVASCPPIVAVTANAFEEDRQGYLEGGMDDYLSKPFEPPTLVAILDRWGDRVAGDAQWQCPNGRPAA